MTTIAKYLSYDQNHNFALTHQLPLNRKLIEIMENIHHIHEVLERVYTENNPYTIQSLYEELINDFGADVHFTNCADNIFPIQEVVPFLLSKNKIKLQEDNIIPIGSTCSH